MISKRDGKRNKRQRTNATALTLRNNNIPLVTNINRKLINVQVPVYACNCSNGTSAYSFYGTINYADLNIKYDIINNAIATREFTDMIKEFQWMKINAFRVRVVPSQIGSDGRLYDAPPYYLLPFVGSQNVSTTTALFSDNAMEVMTGNMARVFEKRFQLPSYLIGSSGYPIGGTAAWIQGNAYSTNANLFLVLGYQQVPSWSSGNAFSKVAVIDVMLEVDFAGPFTL